MDKWFHKQSKIIQILLLIIPVVNWFTEIFVRWSSFLKRGGGVRLVISLLVTFFGLFIGWLDAIWVAIKNRLIAE